MAKGLTMMWQQDCSITEGICHLEWCEDESDTLHHFQPRTRELVLSFLHFFTLWSAGFFFHAEKTWVAEKLIFSSFSAKLCYGYLFNLTLPQPSYCTYSCTFTHVPTLSSIHAISFLCHLCDHLLLWLASLPPNVQSELSKVVFLFSPPGLPPAWWKVII